jgi:hypothetical protein
MLCLLLKIQITWWQNPFVFLNFFEDDEILYILLHQQWLLLARHQSYQLLTAVNNAYLILLLKIIITWWQNPFVFLNFFRWRRRSNDLRNIIDIKWRLCATVFVICYVNFWLISQINDSCTILANCGISSTIRYVYLV